MPALLMDTHAHLMDPAFEADRDKVVERAGAAGVAAMLLVGYDLASSRAAIALARRLPGATASVGIHPNAAAEHTQADFEALAALASGPEVVAIGETGLDYYRRFTPPDRQRQALDWHLQLAEERALPVIVHNRQADPDIARALARSAKRRAAGCQPGVLHCFSSTDQAYLGQMLDAGYRVSFAGTLTFKSADDLRSMARYVPLDRVLVETDCPFLAPAPHRGRRNEPAFVRDTAVCLANVLGMSFGALAERLWANSSQVFGAGAAAPRGVGAG